MGPGTPSAHHWPKPSITKCLVHSVGSSIIVCSSHAKANNWTGSQTQVYQDQKTLVYIRFILNSTMCMSVCGYWSSARAMLTLNSRAISSSLSICGFTLKRRTAETLHGLEIYLTGASGDGEMTNSQTHIQTPLSERVHRTLACVYTPSGTLQNKLALCDASEGTR